ncbi:N-acetylglucosamine kinase [Clostridium fungisolvens]|uniref:N-acetylmuramic acid/N-acetylglucosamine kinase n=1 Tax=Clostridium fungisolvens TaxID=1604897 RepID=A0A6V8SL69_9CLOT|nr:BadF/BadG/BcrA/BcrD ATPase family protein [Clostridium fungisolvens]GFP77501.1 N-acetylmuramic acid/N-acetylglucosamine kinase [Clostridium fungisolvens]
MKYVIGVDGGGTKTEAIAFDMQGNMIKSSTKGFGNLLNGKEQALNNIEASIKDITDALGTEDLAYIYLGLAGSEFGNNAKFVEKVLENSFKVPCEVMNDGELALKALLKGEDGILTIAGTGSICFGINNKISERAGGWGNLLGDEGSAYKIAIEALKLMIIERDYKLPFSDLSISILKYLNINEAEQIVEFVYSKTKDEIAALAAVVSEEAEKGNEAAINILVTEGISLARTTECVYKKLNFDSCSIGLVGGAIRKSKILRNAFEEYLKQRLNIISFIDEDMSPAKGAYYIYRKSFE